MEMAINSTTSNTRGKHKPDDYGRGDYQRMSQGTWSSDNGL